MTALLAEREEFARYFAWAYGGDEYAESGSSREHWLEVADDFLARPFMRAYVEARVQAAANIARIEGRAEALNAACHEIDDDEDAQLLARRAIQWEREAATLRAAAAQPTDGRTGA